MDGKGISIWDAFSHKKGKIFLNDTADSSCEGYHKFKVTWKKWNFLQCQTVTHNILLLN